MRRIAGSEALKARARAIRDELTDLLSNALASAAGLSAPDATTHLVAALTVASWEVAFLEAHRIFRETHNVDQANEALLAIIDQAAKAERAAAKGSSLV